MPNTQQLLRDLDYLCLPEKPWMPVRHYENQEIKDVVIVGAGMAGCTLAAALTFAGISNIQLIDQASAHYEGPWNSHARMQTLRSPKDLTGPALGIASLTFRAWYCAQFGEKHWEQLDRIPTLLWHDYLQWYKHVLALPVQNDTELLAINQIFTKNSEHLTQPIAKLTTRTTSATGQSTTQTRYARHVVLATGMDGLGKAYLPPVTQSLSSKATWAHSSERIDFSTLKNKRVAIIGGGDSALDAAATALDAGARQADVFLRASEFSQINYWKAFTHSGHRYAYTQLSTEQKTQLLQFLLAQRTPPSRGTIQRLAAYENLQLHFEHDINDINEMRDGTLLLQANTNTGHSSYQTDFIIFATGYATDLSQRKELRELLPYLALVEQSTLGENLSMHSTPMLNQDFSFQANNTAPSYPLLSQIHCFTSQALLSVGKICGDIPSISVGANQLCQGIAAKLYQAEFNWHFQEIKAYSELEVEDQALGELIQMTRQHIRNRAVV